MFPIFPWILKVLVIIFALIVGLNLISLDNPIFKIKMKNGNCICPTELNYENNSLCDPKIFNSKCKEENKLCISSVCHFTGNEFPLYLGYLFAYNIIGFIWVTLFVSDLGRMILEATFATWYWTFRKEDVPFFTITVSIWRTFR